jgi:HK97 family phage prohead protease
MDFATSPFDIKQLDESGFIAGLAAGIGNADHGGDVIMPGAFAKTLHARAGRSIPMLMHHDLKKPVGVWTKLTETPAGLEAEGKLTLATRDAQEAHALVKDGALGMLSIGYKPDPTTTRYLPKGRELHNVSLHEVSLVTVGMNDRATITRVKSIGSIGDLQDLLRNEGGMSSRMAKAAASAAWKAINDNDETAAIEAKLAAILTTATASLTSKYGS